jgi:hypothetical protein
LISEVLEHRRISRGKTDSADCRGVHRGDVIGDVPNDRASVLILVTLAVAAVHSASTGSDTSLVEARGHMEALRATVSLLGTTELNQRFLQVRQGSLNETVAFFEVL